MQTFAPYPDIDRCASVLDGARLRSNVAEAWVMLTVKPGSPWSRHVVTRMWAGHEYALRSLALACSSECARRGYKEPYRARLEALTFPDTGFPSWWGDPSVHHRYRSLLRAKLPDWYRPRLPVEEDVPFNYPIPMLSKRKNR